MGELTSALDGLAAEDLYPLTGRAVLDRVSELVAAQNRIAAELARSVRRAECAQAPEDDGQRSMAAWLRGHCRLSPAAAAQAVRAGRAVEHLPQVGARFADGSITADQVDVVAAATRPQRLTAAAALGIDLAEIDAIFADVAASPRHTDLPAAVRRYLAHLDQDGPEPDPTEQRFFTMSRHGDGSLSFRGQLDAVGGERLQAALTSIEQASRPAGDERSVAQQRADALVQLVDNRLAAGNLPVLRGSKPQVLVTVGLADLVDPSTGPCAAEGGFGAVLSAARARWVACDADITRIVLGPDGQPLDVGRSYRLVPAHLRRAVVQRDLHCGVVECAGRGVRCPQPVVRRPPPASVGDGRGDQPRELRAALRTSPHQGPRRFSRRPGCRRSVANLSIRRHRNLSGRPVPLRSARRAVARGQGSQRFIQ